MKKLSIIIPHYNSPNLLEKLLESIPDNEEIQVIVIDDKSDLQTHEYKLLRENNKYSNIVFLENNEEEKGAGVCRNIGLRKAVGQWVLFADADDYFTEGFYEIVSRYFESDNDVIFFLMTSIELDTGNISHRHINYNNNRLTYNQTKGMEAEIRLRYLNYSPWAKMINLNFINIHKISFDAVIASNDVMFSTKVGHHMEKFLISEEIIYCVTKSKGTLTTSWRREIFYDRLKVHINRYNYLKEHIKQNEIDIIYPYGGGYLIIAIKNKYSIKEICQIYKELRNNNVKLFNKKKINLVFLIKKSWNLVMTLDFKKKIT